MRQLTTQSQLLLAAGLGLLMVLTRSPQVVTYSVLCTASWAVFFAAGFYLRSKWAFPAFLGLAFATDAVALGASGVSNYCLTPTYAMLIPAYGCLWAAGRWYAGRHTLNWNTLAPLAGAVIVGALGCEAFSSGAFYWLSGRFAEPNMGEFLAREAVYFPAYLATLVCWVAAGAAGHAAIALAGGRDSAAGAVPR